MTIICSSEGMKPFAACVLIGLALLPSQSVQPRQVCFTIDDLPWVSAAPVSEDAIAKQTRQLIAALVANRIPAIGFVNEQKLAPNGTVDERRVRLLQYWLDAGMELGNHTFSHLDLHATTLDEFQRDVVRGEAVTSKLLAASGKRLRYFRHPMLHTGRSLETKRGLEAFLAARGYRVAPITIDNYDYLFARAYDRANGKERARILGEYLRYMEAVTEYYERQSQVIVGREIRQTLLLHANALNADAMPLLAQMFAKRGYAFISLDHALEDPAYKLDDTFTGQAGMTWLHRWAITQGKKGIFAGEPTVPDWIGKMLTAEF
jgi:peptidoglycan/xylan/chitin deacetylase (PgdA/CDA1 family)